MKSWPHRHWLRRIERRAGLTVAVPVCSFGLLLMIFVRVTPPEEPPPMRITIESVEADPPPEPPEPPPVEAPPIPEQSAVPEEVAATRINSDERGDEVLVPLPGEPAPAEEADSVPQPPMAVADWQPTASDAAELTALAREVQAMSRSLQQKQTDLSKSIVRMEVTSAAKDFIANSDGAAQGAIRLLNLEGFTTSEVVPILQRYGFRYERRHVTPSSGRSFLNAAVTDTGVFTNQHPEGVYDVLVHSAKSMAIMTTREVEAMARQGFDPRRSRVVKVVFGLVRRENGELDLDVVELVAEQIR